MTHYKCFKQNSTDYGYGLEINEEDYSLLTDKQKTNFVCSDSEAYKAGIKEMNGIIIAAIEDEDITFEEVKAELEANDKIPKKLKIKPTN